jgi:hypothetical protein
MGVQDVKHPFHDIIMERVLFFDGLELIEDPTHKPGITKQKAIKAVVGDLNR